MGLAEGVAKARNLYHLEAIELNNVLNQLGIRKDDKAEEVAKYHVMTLVNDVWPRIYGQKAVDEMMAKGKGKQS